MMARKKQVQKPELVKVNKTNVKYLYARHGVPKCAELTGMSPVKFRKLLDQYGIQVRGRGDRPPKAGQD